MGLLITIINSIFRVLVLTVFIYTLLGYFMDRRSSIYQTIGQIVEPMLIPIGKILPTFGGLDFSPLALMLLLQFLNMIIVGILRGLS
jgi:YggT family protein